MKILKFQASWCGPCKMLSETLSTMEIPYPVCPIDIDEQRDVAIEYGIRSVPTMLLIDENENIIERIVGNISKSDFQDKLSRYRESLNGQ